MQEKNQKNSLTRVWNFEVNSSIVYYCNDFWKWIKTNNIWKGSSKDELVHEKEKFKAISDELDQTFAEMSGY